MRFYKLSNGVIINLDTIATITKPVKHDPYNNDFGATYKIILTSGCKHECYDYAKYPNSSTLHGNAILRYSELCEILGLSEGL